MEKDPFAGRRGRDDDLNDGLNDVLNDVLGDHHLCGSNIELWQTDAICCCLGRSGAYA